MLGMMGKGRFALTLLLAGVAFGCSDDGGPSADGGGGSAGTASGTGGAAGSGAVSGSGGSATGGTGNTGNTGSGGRPTFAVSDSETPEGVVASIRVRDPDSGAVYDAVGRPVEGAADRLTPLVGYNQFYFAWAVFNHDSEIYGSADRVDTASLEPDTECAVPCDEINLGCPGKDCIPALTAPTRVRPGEPGTEYLTDTSFVVGVDMNGEQAAYPHNIFWWHEIANDVVGGMPIAVTHCPLTFSSIGHDPTAFLPGQTVELGVSGRLYNNNLTFYNRTDDSWFVQLLGVGTTGDALNQPAPRVHVWEMTWAAWHALHPDTTVLSQETGHARNYEDYPYGSYFVDGSDFRPTNPPDDGKFQKKTFTYGLRHGDGSKAYLHPDLEELGMQANGAPIGVINDTVGGRRVAVVFDIDAFYVQAFDAEGLGDLELVP